MDLPLLEYGRVLDNGANLKRPASPRSLVSSASVCTCSPSTQFTSTQEPFLTSGLACQGAHDSKRGSSSIKLRGWMRVGGSRPGALHPKGASLPRLDRVCGSSLGGQKILVPNDVTRGSGTEGPAMTNLRARGGRRGGGAGPRHAAGDRQCSWPPGGRLAAWLVRPTRQCVPFSLGPTRQLPWRNVAPLSSGTRSRACGSHCLPGFLVGSVDVGNPIWAVGFVTTTHRFGVLQ
ncbi:hypothetical protein VTK26DRAFT_3518 [Humicola hyalothermophila]